MISGEFDPNLVDVLSELTSQVARLARAMEGRSVPAEAPIAIHYGSDSDFLPPQMPRNQSWHQKLRGKKVSLPAATGTSLLVYGLAELIRVVLEKQW